jgi:hypothetical protein
MDASLIHNHEMNEDSPVKKPTNLQIADVLDRIADMLEVQDANPFRVRAYREGADEIRSLDTRAANFVEEHRLDDLKALPKIGDGIAAIIAEFVSTGRSGLLQELQTKSLPEAALMQVPGIGQELASRVVEQLQVNSLEELETAAHDGRLETVEGFGPRRVKGIRTALAGMLSRSALSKQQDRTAKQQSKGNEWPSVALLLEIDSEYRQRAKKDELHKIAPRRFNPDHEAWLPVMHTKRQGWSFTVMYSNTAQAHQLAKTDDWVVIYYEQADKEQQNTVVTETQGALKGKRVVRGRDAESQEYYRVRTG